MHYVLLENVRSKFNVGSIFRTAEAFAFDKVITTGFTPQIPDAEIAKTAIGAEEVVAWQYWQNSVDAIKQLKKEGFTIVVAEVDKRSVKLPDFKKGDIKNVCIVLGNEIAGVSEEVLNLADIVLEIPMLGTVKESLNVEVTFGILSAWMRFNK